MPTPASRRYHDEAQTLVALVSRAADIRAAVTGPPFAATSPAGDADAFEALGLNLCAFLLFFLFHLFLCFWVTLAYTKVATECYKFLLKTDPVSFGSVEQSLVVAHLMDGFNGRILPFKDVLNGAFPGDVFNLSARKCILRGQGF